MAEKVFISYSHQDSSCAHGIARYLSRHGCDVWIDSDRLSLGGSWSKDIDEALLSSDVVVAILSANSLRRTEVLREISLAFKRMKEDGLDKFRLFFVVIGQIHSSWFKDKDSSAEISDYLSKYQYIELSAYGEVTIDSMKKLLRAIRSDGIEKGNETKITDDSSSFINHNSLPEKAFDNDANNIYYKTFPADLATSCVYPFAIDNQWLPEELYDPENPLYDDFERNGFLSDKIVSYLNDYRKRNFLLSLFHCKQVIIKRNSLIYTNYFKDLIRNDDKDKEAFISLLSNGSIIVFLYGINEFTPYISKIKADQDKDVIEAWNKICADVSLYCIKENWTAQDDMHSAQFLRFCSNLAINRDNNMMLAANMHLDDSKIDEFLVTLKTISMQAFCQTHMNGTQAKGKVDPYSRTMFYRNYIVKNYDLNGQDPVHNCLYDPNKPFHHQLKRLIDIYYNSIFTNCFQCKALFPDDVKPENFFLNSMYLNHGEKEVSIEELQFAFSEFFENCEILDEIEGMGDQLYLKNWDLPKIVELRKKEEWFEYVELLEMINRRSNHWKVDFNEIELLMQRFLSCFDEKKEAELDPNDIAYTFRVCIGSKVMDIVKNTKVGKIREYDGIFIKNMQAPLKIQFSIGDLSRPNRNRMIAMPVILFDGMIDTADAPSFFNNLKEFIAKEYDFVKISE